jgi:LytS/YehU family sensor histidine kinase
MMIDRVFLPDPEPPAGDAVTRAIFRRGEARRTIVIVTLGLWGVNFLLLTTRSFVDAQPQALELAFARFVIMLIGVGFCYIIHLVLKQTAARPFWQQLVAAVVVTVIAAECFAWVNAFGAEFVLLAPAKTATTGAILFNLAFWVWFFLAWGAVYLAVAHSARSADREQRLAEMREYAQEARLMALRYQVNPHFLFNTLNSISALILDGRSRDAEDMIARLSDFFRATLAVDPVAKTRLDEEIALQRAYLAVEQVRFPDMRVVIDLREGTECAQVPPLILQPLIENALKFGVARSAAATTVRVLAARCGETLYIRVEDDGARAPPATGHGVGLTNVRERLRVLYEGKAALKTERGRPSGYRVTIEMPYEALA